VASAPAGERVRKPPPAQGALLDAHYLGGRIELAEQAALTLESRYGETSGKTAGAWKKIAPNPLLSIRGVPE